MSTSNRTVVLEAGGAAVIVAGALALYSPQDLWLSNLGFHPGWIAVLVLAAHYGCLGLFVALGLNVTILSLTSLWLGNSVDGLIARAANPSDLFALGASILVAWLAMLHANRIAQLQRRLALAERDQLEANEALAAFHEHVAPLKQRYERIDLSINMWRDLAGRLESGDAAQAARAALDLSRIRSGAQSGVVHCWEDGSLKVLARCGRESGNDAYARDILFVDRTAKLAVDRRRPVLATDVHGATEEDSDVAAPIIDEMSGEVLGVLALHGVSPTRLRAADVNDLMLVAQWLAPALARSLVSTQVTISNAEAAI